MSATPTARIISLRLVKIRRGLLINTTELEKEFSAPFGSFTRSVGEFVRRCPAHAGRLQRVRDCSFDLDVDQFYAWTHLGVIRPTQLGRMLRSRATSLADRAIYRNRGTA